MRTHFPTFALATALLAGSMTFAQAAGTVGSAGTMSTPSVGARPSIGATPVPGLTVHTSPTTKPNLHQGLLPCRTGQGTNCAHE